MLLKKILRKFFKPIRGKGFAGSGRQKQRTKQIAVMEKLGVNRLFIDNYPELLYCNESYISVADRIDVANFLEKYFESQKNWMNYPLQVPDLQGWRDRKGHDYTNPHPALKHVVDYCVELNPASILDVGAGAGVVSKYIFAARDERVKISCLEGSEKHLAEMRENFDNSDIIPPKIKVQAEIIKGVAQKLPFEDNSFELVFTCTVMMHNPYIAAVAAACELARVSSKYVLHVEGYHTDGIAGFRDKYNLLMLDYQRLYERLGFKTLKKFFYRDPYVKEYDYIVYLAQKA